MEESSNPPPRIPGSREELELKLAEANKKISIQHDNLQVGTFENKSSRIFNEKNYTEKISCKILIDKFMDHIFKQRR